MFIQSDALVDFIKKSKSSLRLISYPQEFCDKFHPHTNCMAYAIGLTIPDYDHIRYVPGALGNEHTFLYKERLVSNTIKDLKLLGVSCTVISQEEAINCTEPGKQIVALFYSPWPEEDFHFIRKDKDGSWSHKIGYTGIPTKFDEIGKQFLKHFELIAYLSLSLE